MVGRVRRLSTISLAPCYYMAVVAALRRLRHRLSYQATGGLGEIERRLRSSLTYWG